MTAFIKTPDEVLDYNFDFADPRDPWLTPADTIFAVTAALADGDTSGVVIDSVAHTDTVVKLWLSGGIDGQTATIEIEAVTSEGRTKEEIFKLRIRAGC